MPSPLSQQVLLSVPGQIVLSLQILMSKGGKVLSSDASDDGKFPMDQTCSAPLIASNERKRPIRRS